LIRPMFLVNSVIGGRGDACVALSLQGREAMQGLDVFRALGGVDMLHADNFGRNWGR